MDQSSIKYYANKDFEHLKSAITVFTKQVQLVLEVSEVKFRIPKKIKNNGSDQSIFFGSSILTLHSFTAPRASKVHSYLKVQMKDQLQFV